MKIIFREKKDENLLLINLFFMCLSIGIWSNYRQLWLQDVGGFTVTQISRILSVALICSAVIAFVISVLSAKVKIRDVILEAALLRTVALAILLVVKTPFVIKSCILLTIMCEVIYSISYYPLLSRVNKSDEMYRKKSMVDYIAKDIGVIGCGLLIGVAIGNYIFDYNTCLIIALLANTISGYVLIFFDVDATQKSGKLKDSFIRIIKDKVTCIFLTEQFLVYLSVGIVFDLIMLILTNENYINFSVSFASIFIIACNFGGSVACSIFNKVANDYSSTKGAWIKFGIRSVTYFVAAATNNYIAFIVAIIVAYVTARILEDKVTGAFLKRIDDDDQFLFGNMKYFASCVGEGIGAFIAGICIASSLKLLFLVAGCFTLLQTIVLTIADKLNKKSLW